MQYASHATAIPPAGLRLARKRVGGKRQYLNPFFELHPGPVAESDEDKSGVILAYDAQGRLVSLEILDASQRVDNVESMEYQAA